MVANVDFRLGYALLAALFFANALGLVDQQGATRDLENAGAPPRMARLAVLGGRLLQFVAGSGLFVPAIRPFAAFALIGFLALATLAAHAFWRAAPQDRDRQLVNFLKNAALIGGLLLAVRS